MLWLLHCLEKKNQYKWHIFVPSRIRNTFNDYVYLAVSPVYLNGFSDLPRIFIYDID